MRGYVLESGFCDSAIMSYRVRYRFNVSRGKSAKREGDKKYTCVQRAEKQLVTWEIPVTLPTHVAKSYICFQSLQPHGPSEDSGPLLALEVTQPEPLEIGPLNLSSTWNRLVGR